MSEPAQAPLPLRRELRKPYFLVRTPDALGTYLQREISRALFNRRDPISRFLVAAQLTGPQVRPPAIEYDLEGRSADECVRLDAISDAELEAFEAAAKEFLAKADPSADRVSPHERELRAQFRLPDPDKEPDSYWLHGPPHDRKLLILWGCEFEPNTSLPLLPRKGQPTGHSVLEKLAARRMRWEAKQAEAIELMRRSSEALATFIAKPVRDAKGKLKSVIVDGKTIPAETVATPRHLPLSEIRRLVTAAEAFYAKASPDDQTTSKFEKELRASLRFPSPETSSDSYVMVKTNQGLRMQVLMDGTETESNTAPVIEHDYAPTNDDTQPVDVQLRSRIRPTLKYVAIAASAIVVAAAGLVIAGTFADKTPPVLQKIIAENDSLSVRLVFDKPINASTLYSTEEQAARAAPTPPLISPQAHIDVRDRAGKRLTIDQVALDPNSPEIAIITLNPRQPLIEESYTLYLEGLAGTTGVPLPAKLEKSFDYRDRLPPQLIKVSGDSGDASRLILVFDEPLDDGRVERTRNYRLPGFEFKDAKVDPKNPNIVLLTATTGFTNLERYTIGVVDLRDRSKERNEITQEITQDFVYQDTLPPSIEKITAANEQIYVEVMFTEPVTEGPAQTPGNYVITAPDLDKPFAALSAQLTDGERNVRLRVPPLENGRNYTLKVLNLTDRATPPVKIAENNSTEFAYVGSPDLEGPIIETLSVRGDGQRLTLTFNEPVEKSTAFDAANFSVLDKSFNITQVAASPNDETNRVFLLTPDRAIPELKSFRLVVSNLRDLIGNISPSLTSAETTRAGLGIVPTNVLGFRFITAGPDGKTIQIEFTNEVTPETAKDPANYFVSDDIKVESAAVDEVAHNFRSVTLVVTPALGKQPYSVTARNLARNDNPNLVQREMTESFNGPGYSSF